MSNHGPDIQDFIRKCIRSVGHLEVFLLLGKSPEKKWSAQSVSQELRSNPSYARSQLIELERVGLLIFDSADETYRLAPESLIKEQHARLQEAYDNKRTTVITWIYEQPLDRIRDLADAFKLKKD